MVGKWYLVNKFQNSKMVLMKVISGAWALPTDAHGSLVVESFENS